MDKIAKHPLRIKEWRKLHNITQAEIAAVFGISQSHYSELESGKSPMSLDMFLEIVNVLHSCPSQLVETRYCENCTLPNRKYALKCGTCHRINKIKKRSGPFE